ncbi:MAG: dienelactone hydrolase family protein [Deltaproteobacteria bacterium]
MTRAIIICLIIFSCAACVHGPAPKELNPDRNIVTFASSEVRLFGTLLLSGRLQKPAGDGPFPAVVLLHGCGGIQPKRDHIWAERLVSWGYATLQVDSFQPRRISSVCTVGGNEATDNIVRRVADAFDAQRYLTSLPFVDSKRIAVMGWSNGGVTTLHTLYPKRDNPFQAAVAMYPSCRKSLAELNAPLLILIGAKDDWTPAERCVNMMPTGKSNYEVSLKVFPDAYHAFDMIGKAREVMGSQSSHHLEHNVAAEKESIVMGREFLEKYLKR